MVGPVLYQEMLLGGRRGRAHLFRWLFAGWLVVQLLGHLLFSFLTIPILFYHQPIRPGLVAEAARAYIELYVAQQFLLLAVVTPALAAGAVTDEKARGTLQYLLAADLRPWEIVLGKLLGRSYQVLLLAMTGLPLLCFIGVFGGLDLVMLLTVGGATVAFVFAVAAGSLLASVWCRHTRDAVLCVYAAGLLALLPLRGLPGWLNDFDPFHALSPGWTLDTTGASLALAMRSMLAWGILGAVCLVLASCRLRTAYVRQLEGEGKQKKARWWRARRPAVSDNPLRWKERHVEGVAPLAVLRGLPRWLGLLLVAGATLFWSGWILLDHLPPNETGTTLWHRLLHADGAGLWAVVNDLSSAAAEFYRQGYAVMLLAGVVIAIRCSGAVTGERERQTWEALLLTPLETRELIRGKLWGIVGASYPYLLAYALPALALAWLGGLEAVGWTALWLAVTWLALFYVGAAGLWCSVRSKGSWRSLLGTLGLTYAGGFVLFCVVYGLAGIVAMILLMVLLLLQTLLGRVNTAGLPGAFSAINSAQSIAFCITLAAAFFLLAWMLIRSAEYRVGILERTKHWKDEPRRPRRRGSRY